MATAVVMPKLGNTVESSIIVAWKKKRGDKVAEGEPICEIETDKAALEVESPASGTLLDIFFEAGDDVPVLVNIAAIGEPGENFEALRPSTASSGATVSGAISPALQTPAQSINGRDAKSQPRDHTAGPDSGIETGGKHFVSPRARNLAQRKHVDIGDIHGTGPGGRIIERDVQAALENQPHATPLAQSMLAKGDFAAPERGSGFGGRITTKDLIPAVSQPGREPSADEVEVVRLQGMRRIIAARMLQSVQTTAQLTLNASADARGMLAYRKRLKTSPESLELQNVTLNDLILFAVSRTLPAYPDLNALFEGETVSKFRHVHLAAAVDTPRGLMVPVIRSADTLSLKQLSAEARRLADACLQGKAMPDELSGGTFTVTNLGSLGIESFTPVLNPPQVAILGVGNVNLKAVQIEDVVEHIPHITLSLTIDHQVVDGAPAARFLQTLTHNIANVELLLAL